MLLIIDDRIGGIGIAQLINLGLVASTDREPVLISVGVDFLALVKEAGYPRAEDIVSEIDSKFLIEIDVVAVFF